MTFKVDWDDAPGWANYVAMDPDGEWFWFENKPAFQTDLWMHRGGKVSYYCETLDLPNWEETLEERPKYRLSTPEEEKAVDDALGIVEVTFRMDKDVLAKVEAKAKEMGIIPKALMRSILASYVESDDAGQ